MLPAPRSSLSVSAQGSGSRGGDRWGHAGHEAFVWPVVAAAQTRRWRLPWGRGHSPWPGEHWALGIRPFCWGLTSGSGPFPAAPHQPFNFQLDLLLSHGNGMQIGLGLTGSRLRPASRSPSLGVIPSQIGWPVVPGVRGSPCPPGMEQQPPSAQADFPHCSHMEGIGGWVSPGLSSRTDSLLFWAARPTMPSCHPVTSMAQALHPLACAGCGWDGLPRPGWVRRGLPGGMVVTAQQSPAGRDHSATKCRHLPPGPLLASAGVRRGEGPGGRSSAAGRAGGGEGAGGAGSTRRVDLGE